MNKHTVFEVGHMLLPEPMAKEWCEDDFENIKNTTAVVGVKFSKYATMYVVVKVDSDMAVQTHC